MAPSCPHDMTPIGYSAADMARIAEAVPADWWIEYFPVLESTQETCRELARDRDRILVLASHQTAARGRRGRAWVQQPALDLSLSLSVRPENRYAPLLLPFIFAVALHRVASSYLTPRRVPTRVKWPNDVLADERKLAGILIEGQDDGSYVIGLGLNVNSLDFPTELRDRATSLSLCLDGPVDRGEVCARALTEVFAQVSAAESGRGDTVVTAFAEAFGYVGEPVVLATRNQRHRGVLVGIGPEGARLDEGRLFELGEIEAISSSREP